MFPLMKCDSSLKMLKKYALAKVQNEVSCSINQLCYRGLGIGMFETRLTG